MNAKELQAEIEANGVYWLDKDGEKKQADWETFKSESAYGERYLQDGTKTDPVDSFREDEYWHDIFKIGDQHYRLIGRYSSWDGVDYDYVNIEEVYPKEVKKVVYSTKP